MKIVYKLKTNISISFDSSVCNPMPKNKYEVLVHSQILYLEDAFVSVCVVLVIVDIWWGKIIQSTIEFLIG